MEVNNNPRTKIKTELLGSLKLTLAHFALTLENLLHAYGRAMALVLAFLVLACFGFFSDIPGWVHLILLAAFLGAFFTSFGHGLKKWRPVTASQARRRVEAASKLQHRPLDILDDKLVASGKKELEIWEHYVAQTRERIRRLAWPALHVDWKKRDPYHLRYVVLVLLALGSVAGWGVLGGRVVAALNPALAIMPVSAPTVAAWITPPEYTHKPTIMIATAAGINLTHEVIDVPEGSLLSIHLAEKDGTTPVLSVNDTTVDLAASDGKDFEAQQVITKGDSISLRRGWRTLGSWHVNVVTDRAPQIAFTDTPDKTERKSLRVAFEADDDYGVTNVLMRITPRQSMPGVSDAPQEITLSTSDIAHIKRTAYVDLTASPWAGIPVDIQLIATDAVGHRSESDTVNVVLPERTFFHPVARALIDERHHLMLTPFDNDTRNEAANLMAGLANDPGTLYNDPLSVMALRAGAVRLLLEPNQEATETVDNILWQTATRLEDGGTGSAEQNLRDAQRELGDALDRNAGEKEVQRLIDRLHQAMAEYLSQLSVRMAHQPGIPQDLAPVLGQRTNMLTPNDLDQMLNQMRGLSASGNRDAARQELARLQQMLENIRTEPQPLTAQQQAALERLRGLRAIAAEQQKLMDKTFQGSQQGKLDRTLQAQQNDLLKALKGLMPNAAPSSNAAQGMESMHEASQSLGQGQGQPALEQQGEALKALQAAADQLADDLQKNMLMLPNGGSGMADNDPLGRGGPMLQPENGKPVVPEHMNALRARQIMDELQKRSGDQGRSRSERDYIDRLLQNF
ncbi:MAG: DUF4175 family protein [Alphaproteobacteria bacterium]|nr:DUF4175 family protein [Alphaproteobacteria bacterium]